MMLSRTAIGVILIVALTACGGGDGPTGPDGGIGGTYPVEHNFVLVIDDVESAIPCPGTIQLTQSNATLGGSVTVNACEAIEQSEPFTSPLTGTATSGGAITFELVGQEAIVAGLTDVCITSRVVRADEAFSGTVVGSTLRASFDVEIECDLGSGPAEVTFSWNVEGTRSAGA